MTYAVLEALDGFSKYVPVPEPPPYTWFVPVQQPWACLKVNTVAEEPRPFKNREFRLQGRDKRSGYYVYREIFS